MQGINFISISSILVIYIFISDEVLQNDTKLVSPVKRGKRKATEIVEEASPPKRATRAKRK